MAMLTSVFLLMIVCLGSANPEDKPPQCIQICETYAERSWSSRSQCLQYYCRQAILGYHSRFGKRTDTTFMRNDIPRFMISSQLPLHSEPKTTFDDMARQDWGTVGAAVSQGQVELDAKLPQMERDAVSRDKQVFSVSKQTLVTTSPFFLVVDQRKSNLIPKVAAPRAQSCPHSNHIPSSSLSVQNENNLLTKEGPTPSTTAGSGTPVLPVDRLIPKLNIRPFFERNI